MKHALSYHDYRALCSIAEQKDENCLSEYTAAIDSLFTNWTSTLGHDKICVLGFILSRTLKYGKRVAGIPFPAFLGGVTSERCQANITSALKMSKNTLRTVLKELVDDGFLHAFFPEKRRGIIDNFTRYFEIDFKKIQRLRSVGSQIMGILRQPKAATVAKQSVSRLPKLGGLSIVPHKIPKGIYTVSPAAHGSDVEDEVQQPATTRRILRSPRRVATPTDAPTPARESADDILARMDKLQADAKARRAAKAATGKAGKATAIQQHQLQAMLDEGMEKYHPTQPRMAVTAKAFGAMRNHLKRSAPADFSDFLNWTLASWGELAQSHAKTRMRRITDDNRKQYEALPSAPNYAALGFRLPFFLACYNNRKAQDALLGSKDDRKDAALEKAQRAAAQAREENASLRALMQKKQQQTRAIATPRPAAYDDAIGQDSLPSWDSLQAKGTK
jgi:hypothetical protein